MSEFQLSVEKIKALAEEINIHAFSGKLNLSSIKVSLSQSKRMLGHVSIRKKNVLFGTPSFVISDLKISTLFNWNEVELKNTIAHELIHIYEAQISQTKPGHGVIFKAQMTRLNSLGYQVQIKGKRDYNQETLISKSKEVVFAISKDRSKIIFASKEVFHKNIKPSLSFNTTFLGGTIGVISESKLSGKYKLSRKYRGYFPMTEEKLAVIGL